MTPGQVAILSGQTEVASTKGNVADLLALANTSVAGA